MGKQVAEMNIAEFQSLIESIYLEKDRARGIDSDFRWFMEEVGELARAIRDGDRRHLSEEFADVMAWLATMASICKVDLADAVGRYACGCPKCGQTPCECD
jgi:NTP pyrophosphatase (non-canonical NTP hydrolase)